MNRLFVVLLLLVVFVIGLGFYRGWFALSSPDADPGSQKVDVNLTVDRDKMQADVDAVKQSASETVDKVTDGADSAGDQTKDNE